MIYKAELIKVVNDSLNRGYSTSGTKLDEKITSVLKDLSQRGNFLQDEFKRATIIDRDYYSLPTNFKDLLFVGMKSSDDVTIYRDLVYERFKEYKRGIYGSSITGTPTRYTWMSGYMYPRPIPDAVYNMYWWYSYYHPENLTVDSVDYKACDYILFKDIYREAIEMGLCYKVALGLNLDNDAKKFKVLYLEQVSIHRANLKEEIKIANYRDGF